MDTIRLLEMAGEIAREGVLRVRRPNRDFLLKARAGSFAYDELVARAEELHAGLETAFASSGLPDAPGRDAVNALLVKRSRRIPDPLISKTTPCSGSGGDLG